MSQRRRTTPLHRDSMASSHCSPQLRHDILAHAAYFEGLSSNALATVSRQFREQHHAQGSVICREGDTARSLFFVAHGKVKLLRHSLGGKDVLLDILPQGGLFGGLVLLGAREYPDTALAQTNCCVLTISGDAFRRLLEQHPGITLEVLKSVSRSLHDARETIRQLTTSPVNARIATILLKLAERLGEHTRQGLLIQSPLPHQDLAAMVGTTPETVSRVMAGMRRDGLVDSGRQWVRILDQTGLQAIADS